MNDETLRERLARLRRDNSVYQATPSDVEMVARGDIQAGELVHMGNLGDNTENRNHPAGGGYAVENIAHDYMGIVGYMMQGDRPVRLTEHHDDMIDAHEIAMRQFTGTASWSIPKSDKVVMTAKKEVVIPRIDRSIR
jgi:hypothetical protein